ncbi:response regulator [Altererythrobacter arenosus]|uniref:Response regulator n=1 Tax=Altererythrobacter arenosus TaxID=3032592 RepID=A0ABY8FMQ8_9SPHN|nr:response regulator [Altererythrobacter sp. CAU 1644]WFL76142.1 response regulator [Altererythrobacter sp. CAU 1644]
MNAPGVALSGLNIWVVEDDAVIALSIEYLIEDQGGSAFGPAGSITDCFEQFAAFDELPDVAILDLDLRGQESMPIAKLLQRKGVPFLFYTGHGQTDALIAQFGEIPVCIKPVSEQELVQALCKLCSRSAKHGRSTY